MIVRSSGLEPISCVKSIRCASTCKSLQSMLIMQQNLTIFLIE